MQMKNWDPKNIMWYQISITNWREDCLINVIWIAKLLNQREIQYILCSYFMLCEIDIWMDLTT